MNAGLSGSFTFLLLASLLVPTGQDVPGMGVNDVVRPASCGQGMRQVVIDVPTIRTRGKPDLRKPDRSW